MTTGLLVAPVIVVFTAAVGHTVMRVLRVDRELGVVLGATTAFLVGGAAVTLLLVYLSPLPGGLAVPAAIALSLPFLPLTALALWSRRPALLRRWRDPASWALALLVLLLLADMAAMAQASLNSSLGWDGHVVWAFKGRVIAAAGAVPSSLLTDRSIDWAHRDYPLMVPGLEALVYRLVGASDHIVKPLFVAFDAALVGMVYGIGRRLRSPVPAALGALLLATRVAYWDWATEGYSDIALGASVAGAIGFLALWLHDRRHADLLLAGLMAAVAAWTKREGTTILALGALVVLVDAARRHRGRAGLPALGGEVARYLAPSLTLVPWALAGVVFGFRDLDHLPATAATLTTGAARLPAIFAMVVQTLTAPDHYGLLWVLAGLALVISAGRRLRHLALIAGAAIAYLGVLAASFGLSSWASWQGHFATSFDRIVLQALALPVLVIVGAFPVISFARPRSRAAAGLTSADQPAGRR